MGGDMGRYGEIWGDMGRCGIAACSVTHHVMAGACRRYGEIWGEVGRCGERWGDGGRVVEEVVRARDNPRRVERQHAPGDAFIN